MERSMLIEMDVKIFFCCFVQFVFFLNLVAHLSTQWHSGKFLSSLEEKDWQSLRPGWIKVSFHTNPQSVFVCFVWNCWVFWGTMNIENVDWKMLCSCSLLLYR